MSEIGLQSEGQQLLLILSIMLPLQVKREAVTGLCSMEGGGGRRAQHVTTSAQLTQFKTLTYTERKSHALRYYVVFNLFFLILLLEPNLCYL